MMTILAMQMLWKIAALRLEAPRSWPVNDKPKPKEQEKTREANHKADDQNGLHSLPGCSKRMGMMMYRRLC
jgi:hypothetical protein